METPTLPVCRIWGSITRTELGFSFFFPPKLVSEDEASVTWPDAVFSSGLGSLPTSSLKGTLGSFPSQDYIYITCILLDFPSLSCKREFNFLSFLRCIAYVWLCLCVSAMCIKVLSEASRGCPIPWCWSYSSCADDVGALNQAQVFLKSGSALNCRAISPNCLSFQG